MFPAILVNSNLFILIVWSEVRAFSFCPRPLYHSSPTMFMQPILRPWAWILEHYMALFLLRERWKGQRHHVQNQGMEDSSALFQVLCQSFLNDCAIWVWAWASNSRRSLSSLPRPSPYASQCFQFLLLSGKILRQSLRQHRLARWKTVERLRNIQHIDIRLAGARKVIALLPASSFTAFHIGKAQPVVRNVAYHVTLFLFWVSKYNHRSESILGPKNTKTRQKTRLSHLTKKDLQKVRISEVELEFLARKRGSRWGNPSVLNSI